MRQAKNRSTGMSSSPSTLHDRVPEPGSATGCAEDADTGYTGNGPQAMATLRNLAISLPHLPGVTEIARTLQCHHA
ncbi:MAG TPA: hypothetical protein VFO01_18990 [Trebonia sp.]|nr:hypothetical protein [Trebonia sp.]